MTRAERFQNREREKRRKELDLLRYSHNLSHKVLTQEGREQLGPELPDAIVSSFQKGSLLDRDAYWQENAKDLNFGQQMLVWMGYEDGKPGMAQWVAKQKGNEAVSGMLQEVGLTGDHEAVATAFNQGKVADLLRTINTDLVKEGEDPLDLKDLNDNEARSLIFYAQYLNPTDKKDPGKDAKELINTLVKQASSESGGDASQTIAKLQQVAPLFRVAGEEGQHVLGALIVAKAHAFDSRDELIKVASDAVLTDDEKSILEFLKKHSEEEAKIEDVKELELGKPYDIQQVFTKLTPEPTPGHKYWIDHEISADFAAKLSPEQLKNLELRKSMWIRENDQLPLNREVFDPAYTLKDDRRFENAEILTGKDSGLLALAAASAKTPEQQMQLYHILGEVAVRTHLQNPELLKEFLQAQTRDSLIQFGFYEMDWTGSLYQRLDTELNRILNQTLKDVYNIEVPSSGMPSQLTSEQMTLLQQKQEEFGKQQYVPALARFDDPERVAAITFTEENGQSYPMLNVEATVNNWSIDRIRNLQETLQKDPLILSLAQIRQIEFLAHAVDSVKVVEMIQQTQAVPRIEEITQPASVVKQKVQTPEVLEETVVSPDVSTTAPKKLEEFFQLFDRLDERTQIQQRQEMVLADTMHLSEFSTEGRDIKGYEIYQTGDEQKNLAIYDVREDENGKMQHYYNQDNYFLKLLLQEDSLSLFSFEQLKSRDLKYGPNTLLAYVLEASKGPVQQESLFKSLFFQVAKIYEEHPDLYKEVLSYFVSISEKTAEPIDEMKVIEPLFGSKDQAVQRLSELRDKLADKEATFTTQDFADMGLFALPFNLQLIAQQMKLAYESHASAPQGVAEPQP